MDEPALCGSRHVDGLQDFSGGRLDSRLYGAAPAHRAGDRKRTQRRRRHSDLACIWKRRCRHHQDHPVNHHGPVCGLVAADRARDPDNTDHTSPGRNAGGVRIPRLDILLDNPHRDNHPVRDDHLHIMRALQGTQQEDPCAQHVGRPHQARSHRTVRLRA